MLPRHPILTKVNLTQIINSQTRPRLNISTTRTHFTVRVSNHMSSQPLPVIPQSRQSRNISLTLRLNQQKTILTTTQNVIPFRIRRQQRNTTLTQSINSRPNHLLNPQPTRMVRVVNPTQSTHHPHLHPVNTRHQVKVINPLNHLRRNGTSPNPTHNIPIRPTLVTQRIRTISLIIMKVTTNPSVKNTITRHKRHPTRRPTLSQLTETSTSINSSTTKQSPTNNSHHGHRSNRHPRRRPRTTTTPGS